MGMGKAVMSNLMDIIDTSIDIISPQEIQVRNSLLLNNEVIISLVAERNEWDVGANGQELRKKVAKEK